MNKKTRLTLALIIIGISVGVLFILLYTRQEDCDQDGCTKDTTTITPTSPIQAEKPLLEAMAENFSKKYNKPADAFSITVDKDFGDYAKGSIKRKEENGGGLWFAAKVKGSWQLVYDGNGIISCESLIQYPEFPSSLIPQCFDNYKDTLIQR